MPVAGGGRCFFDTRGGAQLRWFSSRRFVGGSRVKSTVLALVAFVLASFMLLTGVLVVLPVERAAAESSGYGSDGYFSALTNSAKPIIDNETNTPSSNTATGWANTRRIVFGKRKDATYTQADMYAGASVSSGYKTFAKGKVGSVDKLSPFDNYISANPGYTNKLESATTSVAENEVLLCADDAVTANFKFDTNASGTNSFDSETS
jgi:hypothetical protein